MKLGTGSSGSDDDVDIECDDEVGCSESEEGCVQVDYCCRHQR